MQEAFMVNTLRKRKALLEQYVAICQKFLRSAPEGTLRISSHKGVLRFYHMGINDDRNGKYIPKASIEIAAKLAQKDYYEKILADCKTELALIDKLLRLELKQPVARVFEKLHIRRQAFINPIDDTLQNKMKRWMEAKTDKLEIHKDMKTRVTVNGELVRSTAEKNIADALSRKKLSYKYEAKFLAKNGKVLYPDFSIWQPGTGDIIFWEHFGMMDHPEYVGHLMDKLEAYSSSGIFPGHRLILTFSDSYKRLTEDEIEERIAKIIRRQ